MWNLNVYNLVHSSPPFVPILSPIIHYMPSYPTSSSQNVILSSHLCVYFPGGLPPDFLLKHDTNPSSLSFRPYALLIISFFTWSTVQYFVWVKNHDSPWFCNFLQYVTSFVLGPVIFLITLLLNTPIICRLVM